MTIEFPISELERLVEPEELHDILDTLVEQGMLNSYEFDFPDGVVSLEVNKSFEIQEMLSEMSELSFTPSKKKGPA